MLAIKVIFYSKNNRVFKYFFYFYFKMYIESIDKNIVKNFIPTSKFDPNKIHDQRLFFIERQIVIEEF